jgi:hypothetical protein
MADLRTILIDAEVVAPVERGDELGLSRWVKGLRVDWDAHEDLLRG